MVEPLLKSLLNRSMVKDYEEKGLEEKKVQLELFLNQGSIEFKKSTFDWQTSDYEDHYPIFEVLPQSVKQLSELVKYLNQIEIPFHIVSGGQNWGYGDKNLNQSIQFLINLSRMNRILSFNEQLGFVEIEPGVTQGELSAFLLQFNKSKKWILDITGANEKASVVGNFLERGFGHSSFGDHELYGKIIEGLTLEGKLVVPHQSMYATSLTRGLYQHDSGLNFEKIFYQTNFLIVTKYLVRLRPVPEKSEMAVVLFKDDEAAAYGLELISELKMRGDINSVPHMANSTRVKYSSIVRVPTSERWALTIDISGSSATVQSRKKIIKKYFNDSKVLFFDRFKLNFIEKFIQYIPGFKGEKDQLVTLRQLFKVHSGRPDDGFLKSSFLNEKNEFKRVNWICPLVPSTRNDFLKTRDIIKSQLGSDFDSLPITISVVSDRCAVWVSEIATDHRSDMQEAQRLKNLYFQLKTELENQGYLFYRHSLNGSKLGPDLDQNALFFKSIYSLLKDYFDPKGLLSRGRWL